MLSRLVKHKAELDLEGVIEVPGIERDQFFGFIKSVDERVSVNVQIFGGVGEVQSAI